MQLIQWIFCAILTLCSSVVAPSLWANEAPKVNPRPNSAAALQTAEDKEKSTITVTDHGRTVLRYRVVENPYKPYVDQLTSPAGVQVLRDNVADHIHHHGLMFALAVDGVTFWTETRRTKAVVSDISRVLIKRRKAAFPELVLSKILNGKTAMTRIPCSLKNGKSTCLRPKNSARR